MSFENHLWTPLNTVVVNLLILINALVTVWGLVVDAAVFVLCYVSPKRVAASNGLVKNYVSKIIWFSEKFI